MPINSEEYTSFVISANTIAICGVLLKKAVTQDCLLTLFTKYDPEKQGP